MMTSTRARRCTLALTARHQEQEHTTINHAGIDDEHEHAGEDEDNAVDGYDGKDNHKDVHAGVVGYGWAEDIHTQMAASTIYAYLQRLISLGYASLRLLSQA